MEAVHHLPNDLWSLKHKNLRKIRPRAFAAMCAENTSIYPKNRIAADVAQAATVVVFLVKVVGKKTTGLDFRPKVVDGESKGVGKYAEGVMFPLTTLRKKTAGVAFPPKGVEKKKKGVVFPPKGVEKKKEGVAFPPKGVCKKKTVLSSWNTVLNS